MAIQILFVFLFALNLLLILFSKRFPWYRLPGSFIFAYLPLLTVFSEQPRFELDHFWWRVAGVAVILLGIGLVVWAKSVIGKVLTSLGETPTELTTSGPYQFVRHPMYLGLIFVWVGWWWVWAAVYSFYFGMFILALAWIQGYLEEKLVLEKKFGDRYRDYRSQTGMFWIK
jgi:protein-S-isoprenylcysteine O-methyltransferase Ste14